MIHEKGRLDDCPLGSVHGTGSLKHSRMTVLVSSFQSVKSFNKLNLEFLFPKYSPDPGSCVLVLCFSVFSQRLYWKAVLFYRCKCVRSLRRAWDQPCFENDCFDAADRIQYLCGTINVYSYHRQCVDRLLMSLFYNLMIHWFFFSENKYPRKNISRITFFFSNHEFHKLLSFSEKKMQK